MTPDNLPTFNHQLITKSDLVEFQKALIAELKEIILQNAEPKKWMRSADVRKMLNISPATLQTLRVNGTLNFTKIGKILYYKSEEIQKLFE